MVFSDIVGVVDTAGGEGRREEKWTFQVAKRQYRFFFGRADLLKISSMSKIWSAGNPRCWILPWARDG